MDNKIITALDTGTGRLIPGMSLLRAAYDVAALGANGKSGITKAFSKHIASFEDPAKAIDEIKKLSPLLGAENAKKLTPVLDVIEDQDAGTQKAFQTALSNPKFVEHMLQNGGGDLMNEETLQDVLNGPHKFYAVQLMNQIGTNPQFKGDQAEESFERLDKLSGNIKKFGEAQKKLKEAQQAKNQDEIRLQQQRMAELQTDMVDDMRGLGVNIPEDVSPEILQAFQNIFMHGMSTEQAMDQLMLQLAEKGIDPEAIKSLDAMMRPMAGFMDFLVRPYVQYAQKYGPAAVSGFQTAMVHGENIMEGLGEGKNLARTPEAIKKNLDEIRGYIAKDSKSPTLGEDEARSAAARGLPLNGNEPERNVAKAETGMTQNGEFKTASLGVTIRHPDQAPEWVRDVGNNNNHFAPSMVG